MLGRSRLRSNVLYPVDVMMPEQGRGWIAVDNEIAIDLFVKA